MTARIHHRERAVARRERALLAALGRVELSREQRRIVQWLAGWDDSTVTVVASLFAAGTGRPSARRTEATR